MTWYLYPAYLLGGALLANAVPHLVSGLMGRAFPTPFATPPARGLSPPPPNVLWALINLAAAYLLLAQVGHFELRRTAHVLVAGAGFSAAALAVSWRAGRLLGRDG